MVSTALPAACTSCTQPDTNCWIKQLGWVTDWRTFCLFLASVASLRAKWFWPSHLLVVMHLLASKRSQNSSVCT
jgi:hypothetical protein